MLAPKLYFYWKKKRKEGIKKFTIVGDCLKHTAAQIMSCNDDCLLPSNPRFTTLNCQMQRQCLLFLHKCTQGISLRCIPMPLRGLCKPCFAQLLWRECKNIRTCPCLNMQVFIADVRKNRGFWLWRIAETRPSACGVQGFAASQAADEKILLPAEHEAYC